MDRTGRRPTPADPEDGAPDRQLQCLCSWLERTNQRESQALQARSIVPATMLTFVSIMATISDRAEDLLLALVPCLSIAFGCFLIQDRRREIWKHVAIRLQTEQRVLLSPKHANEWSAVGNKGPDRLYEIYGASTPIQPFSAGALTIYFAAFVFTIFLATVSSLDADKPRQSQAESTRPAPEAPNHPIWSPDAHCSRLRSGAHP